MLESLSIKNIALIDSLNVEFGEGFNVLTGESGAGKSILIFSISFVLGAKSAQTSAQIIRNGAEEASVAAVFSVSKQNKRARQWLDAHNITIEEDSVLLRRTLKSSGRSACWISSTPVTRAELAEFSAFLLDIHGQHESQSLFKVSEHRRFLDGFAGIEDREVKDFTKQYGELAKLREEYTILLNAEKDEMQRSQMLTFAVSEIEAAHLQANEEEELKEEEGRLTQFEKLLSHLENATSLLQEEGGCLSLLRRSTRQIKDASEADTSLKSYAERLEASVYELEDVSDSLLSYYSALSFSPERLEEVQSRLSLISTLKKKYASSSPSLAYNVGKKEATLKEENIQDVLDYCAKAKQILENEYSIEEKKCELEQKIKAMEVSLLKLGRLITATRCKNKERMQEKITAIIRTLGMKGATFVVNIKTQEEHAGRLTATPFGFDEVEFLISANEGEGAKPLAHIASGGEISRVMLAIKSVLSTCDDVETMIFDEVDTGIGGDVAVSVAHHIKELAEKKQVLLITHLAIIAASADKHKKVEKTVVDGKTFTKVFPIDDNDRIKEIARMLAGDEMSEASLFHASELLQKQSGKRCESVKTIGDREKKVEGVLF